MGELEFTRKEVGRKIPERSNNWAKKGKHFPKIKI